MTNITQLLLAWTKGDAEALAALRPRVQQELHRLAVPHLKSERSGPALPATALVNEAYVRLVNWQDVQWADRAHFFAMAATVMRRVLTDYARDRGRQTRADGVRVSFIGAVQELTPESADMLALDDVLKELEQMDPRKSKIIEMRLFGGLSLEETAEALDASVETVRRDWSLARAWLFRELNRRADGTAKGRS